MAGRRAELGRAQRPRRSVFELLLLPSYHQPRSVESRQHAPEEGRPATGSCRHPGGNDSHQGAAQVLLLALAVGARTSRSRNLRRVYHIDFRPLADKEESSELQQLFP